LACPIFREEVEPGLFQNLLATGDISRNGNPDTQGNDAKIDDNVHDDSFGR
jgi:hypothetical protein